MTLRNPTTVDGKTKRKSSGRKSDCQTTTPFVRSTFANQSAILREMASLAAEWMGLPDQLNDA